LWKSSHAARSSTASKVVSRLRAALMASWYRLCGNRPAGDPALEVLGQHVPGGLVAAFGGGLERLLRRGALVEADERPAVVVVGDGVEGGEGDDALVGALGVPPAALREQRIGVVPGGGEVDVGIYRCLGEDFLVMRGCGLVLAGSVVEVPELHALRG